MTFRYALAVDPGDTTGWAFMTMHEYWSPGNVTAGQHFANDFLDWITKTPQFLDPSCLILVESFTVTAQTARLSQQPVAMEVIGVLKFLARRSGTRLEMQTPAAAKRFCSDAQLRKIGLWHPGKDHARDAIRHLILGIVTHGTGQAREELIQSLV
jgi:hypothetical protein